MPRLSGGRKVKTEPNLGMTENPKSAMAALKRSQLIEPRDWDFVKRVEKISAVDELTLRGCGGKMTFSASAGGTRAFKESSTIGERSGLVFSFCFRCSESFALDDVVRVAD